MTKVPTVPARLAALPTALLLLAPFAAFAQPDSPMGQEAGELSIKAEPGVAIPMGGPQQLNFGVGGSVTLKGLIVLNRYLDIGPSVTFTTLGAEADLAANGNAWTFGGGLRLKRPHDAPDDDTFRAMSPWLDVDALYVRTGDLGRPGFAVGAGLAFPIGRARAFWIGPFARYFQIMSSSRDGFDTSDANIFNVGISFELGSSIRRQHADPPAAIVDAPVRSESIVAATAPRADRDGDGVFDDDDHCPDVAGLAETFGCPQYANVVVKRDKLELKEKLYFDWNAATLSPESYPLLDDVARALQDNRGFTVQVEGHSSSEGTDERNQTLSAQRANTVLDYLVSRGVDKSRLKSKGFSSSIPADTNTTAAGRENNRRVEFVVSFSIVGEGSN